MGAMSFNLTAGGRRFFGLPERLLARLFPTLAFWSERARQRRALGELDEERLRDIGIDRVSAAREAGKPFWRT